MSRVKKQVIFLAMAQDLAKMSTCMSRQVGCVLTDGYGRVSGTGFNGAPSGISHRCMDTRCARHDFKSGERLDLCLAIHAEANALMHCTDIKEVEEAFVHGASPCFECAKLLCNSSVNRVYVDRLYCPEHVALIRPMFEERRIKLFEYVNENMPFPFKQII